MTPSAQLKAVDRGVALLDQLSPKWFTKFKGQQFDLTSNSQCALGQVYGDYIDGLKQLADAGLAKLLKSGPIRFSESYQDLELEGSYYGFDISPDTASEDENKTWERMGQHWLLAADQRRKKAAARRKRAARVRKRATK